MGEARGFRPRAATGLETRLLLEFRLLRVSDLDQSLGILSILHQECGKGRRVRGSRHDCLLLKELHELWIAEHALELARKLIHDFRRGALWRGNAPPTLARIVTPTDLSERSARSGALVIAWQRSPQAPSPCRLP